jgi:hypothetical protein
VMATGAWRETSCRAMARGALAGDSIRYIRNMLGRFLMIRSYDIDKAPPSASESWPPCHRVGHPPACGASMITPSSPRLPDPMAGEDGTADGPARPESAASRLLEEAYSKIGA